MNRHLAIKIRRFFVVKLCNSPLLHAFHALKPRILIGNMLDPDLIRGSLVTIDDFTENLDASTGHQLIGEHHG
jgi:hypothetical protein